MTEIAKLDERVTKLEREMPEVRNLASGASSEASDVHARLRAHTKSLEALRITQVEQGKEIKAMRTEMHEGIAEMRAGFSTVGVGMAQITALLKVAIDQSGESDES